MIKDDTIKFATLHQDEIQVTLNFSRGPAYYHLISIHKKDRPSVCLQIKGSMSREDIARFAANIAGLGDI
jgi:hypothetical protein